MGDALAVVALGVSGAAMAVVGWQGLTAPAALLEPVGLAIRGTSGMSEARAAYGGMHLGLGAFFLAMAARRRHRGIGLWAAVAVLGGLFLGRLSSLVFDGAPGSFPLQLLALEGAGALLCAVALVVPARRRR